MDDDRRRFLKRGLLATGVIAVGGAGVGKIVAGMRREREGDAVRLALTAEGELVAEGEVLGLPPTDPAVRVGSVGRRWVMVVDLAACNGCGHCAEACNAMHDTPGDRAWIRILLMKDSPDTPSYWFPRPCFQCDNPPCTRVCPVDATFKRRDGVVLIDNNRCIGCRFCMAACPYSARVFNWSQPSGAEHRHRYSPETGHPRRVGTVEKCDFCPEQLRLGNLPACARRCEAGALYFGDEVEGAITNSKGQSVQLSGLLRDRGGYRHLEDLGTEPRVYYLPPLGRHASHSRDTARPGVTIL